MTFVHRLKTRLLVTVRHAAAGAAGIALAVGIVLHPAQALAQAAPAPTAAAPAAIPQAQGAGPALWVIKDADSTIYLFGTVHVLRPTTAWGSARVDAAFASADEVWFEITNPDDQAAAIPLIQRYGTSPERPLSSLLTAEELADLDAAAKTIGASAAQFEPLRPWFAGLTLAIAPLAKAGYDPNSGVELVLRARAQTAGKPVKGLETLEEQIGILAGLSEETQLDFLRYTLEEFDTATESLDGIVNAWAEGDLETLEQLGVDEMREQSQEVYESLLARRNANWAGQIQRMLEGSGTAFIAVGAAHLAGDDSVQEILEDRGVEVDTAP